jgi:hypothetical protein
MSVPPDRHSDADVDVDFGWAADPAGWEPSEREGADDVHDLPAAHAAPVHALRCREDDER